jgi:hypothetical protein
MKKLFTIVIMLAMVCFASQAMALYTANTDFYTTNLYDYRTYDASHPEANIQHSLGGWYIGFSVANQAMQDEISHVQFTGYKNGNTVVTTLNGPIDAYWWLGENSYDYVLFMGAKHVVCDYYEVVIYKHDGSKMVVDLGNGPTDIGIITPGKTNQMPPVCQIKKMAIMKSGELKMRFTAPSATNVDQIRIRIFDENHNGIDEFRIYPPFEIVKNDGTIIPDMVKTFLPAEYIGHTGRIEYRTNGTNVDKLRGMTFFKLPELEVEE